MDATTRRLGSWGPPMVAEAETREGLPADPSGFARVCVLTSVSLTPETILLFCRCSLNVYGLSGYLLIH